MATTVTDSPERPLPWQSGLWQGLIERHRKRRMPHALLLHGPAGCGKRHLVEALGRALFCLEPLDDGTACGHCSSCRLTSVGNHSEWLRIGLLERQSGEESRQSRQITVDQIREFNQQLGLTTRSNSYRLAVIDPAEKMNVSAANALLKTLEEPGAGNLLLLVCERPGHLPATIRSRCQQLACPPPSPAESLAWLDRVGIDRHSAEQLLALTGGAPLAAAMLAENGYLDWRLGWINEFAGLRGGRIDPLELASKLAAEGEAERALGELARWLIDTMRNRLADGFGVVGQEQFAPIVAALSLIPGEELCRRYDDILDSLKTLEGNANRQLLLERMMIEWAGER